ncbi:hypothetical protein PoB_007402700 [Plakobranchus ocellatus]|uniref:Uncharacterized protein n=1 Tax=Plakobranchus ocellatus TaxID=259542 RepID=A0AAV4DT66_9GAST|nr:hypothetical protein PoB_007402700 [Plakobranchus ocellatus]
MYIACPHQGDLRLSGPLSGQSASGGAQTRNRRVPANLRADSLSIVPRHSPASVEREVNCHSMRHAEKKNPAPPLLMLLCLFRHPHFILLFVVL